MGIFLRNDNIDTLVIADYLRFGRISKEVNLDEKFIALRNLTRARFQVAQNLSRENTRFLDTLFYKFASLDSPKVFSDTFGATSIAVITRLSLISLLTFSAINFMIILIEIILFFVILVNYIISKR